MIELSKYRFETSQEDLYDAKLMFLKTERKLII